MAFGSALFKTLFEALLKTLLETLLKALFKTLLKFLLNDGTQDLVFHYIDHANLLESLTDDLFHP